MSEEDPPPRHRLDPDRAAAAAERKRRAPPPPPDIDTRRYQRMIGFFGLAVVIVVSIAFLTTHRSGTAGIPAGDRLHYFSAPLATSTLAGDANLKPPCTEAGHDPRALNICLISRRSPLVLAFFVTRSSVCEKQVDALQSLRSRFPDRSVAFAAVAVRSNHQTARTVVRSHGWTIPVAYDADGAVGQVYGVEVCPIVELAYQGGRVARRLIGERWADPSVLAGQIQALLRRPAR